MTDPSNFDFGAFEMNNSGGGEFNSYWERDSVKNDNNSFFSDEDNKDKKNSFTQMNFESNKPSHITSKDKDVSLGQFQDAESPSQMKSSGISKRFNVEKESEEEMRDQAVNMSRSIGEIDVSDFEKVSGGYHFEKSIPNVSISKDDNYETLKKYLSEPKKMDFNNFFNDLEKNQDVPNNSFLNRKEYSNAQEFEEYKRKLKQDKRVEEYKWKQSSKQTSKQASQKSGIAIPKVIEINYFKKKPFSSNILDEDMITFNADEGLESRQPVSSGFIPFKPKPTSDKFIRAKTDSQKDFFQQQNKKSIESFESKKSKQPSLPKSKLPMIIDADENIFQTTQQEMKLNNLFNNFKNLMENYNLLRGELKSNTEGHEQIMKEINTLKDNYNKREEEQAQRPSQKLIKEEGSERSGNGKIVKQETKEMINQIEIDIYKKIENLENVVKQTFDKDNDDKNNLVWVNPDFVEKSERSIAHSQHSQPKIHISATPRDESVSRKSIVDEILSPLDLKLNSYQAEEQNYINSRVSNGKSVAFSPQKKKSYEGLCHEPQHVTIDNFYRQACVKDNTVVFESFDFLVSARYTFVRSGRKHLKISMTVKNKTILTLNDFMVILYGSVGEVLHISPPKMYVQKFGPEESKTLEAVVDSIKVNMESIRMQISYRTQRDRKGKVAVKIPRPITKFMDVRFTHEAQFNQIWNSAKHQLYVLPKGLNFELIKSTQDIKLIFPFIQVSQADDSQFSYGLVFSIMNTEGLFLLKLLCNVQGTASLHLKFDDENQTGYGKQILDTLNLIMFK